MKYSGTGTQKAEEDLSKLFPEARILRMDADTVAEKAVGMRYFLRFQEANAISF